MMKVKVPAEFKRDFDCCMGYWQSLNDGFSLSDVEEARNVARVVIADNDKERITEMVRWFKQEADKIRGLISTKEAA